ncbi:hypothetical protein OO015_02305 [Thermomicrobium sp. 4228-Ro]|uniref:hypothetical protein n=1 Tax=Thermomicrobium sp. 4228-Ro TaxID=2993937 RepID=UPI002248CDD2|nr:hypothetical protein [Thermomicrobium sp. 4228-Ro]MCX2726324.1 hypothetical protein [Thermomicrobium sp. 4228-Ro]
MPLATATFLLFVAGSILFIAVLRFPPWVIAFLLPPSFVLTVSALAVALADLLERPRDEFRFGARMVWVVLIALFNVLAFLPYWLCVARHPWRGHPAGERPSLSERSRV